MKNTKFTIGVGKVKQGFGIYITPCLKMAGVSAPLIKEFSFSLIWWKWFISLQIQHIKVIK